MTKKLDMLLGSQSPEDPAAQKPAPAPGPKTTEEVIKVKAETPKTKKTEAPKPAAAKPAAKTETPVNDDAKKEDENGWFSFLKDFGF